ncbi:aromatic ring-hydroxylating oxygenase subunit alpha [Pseudomonas gingeri]
MKHATQVELVHRAFALLERQVEEMNDAPFFNPIAHYTAASVVRREQTLLFEQRPWLLGPVDRLREPGSYRTDNLNGTPLLIVRGQDGVLRGFINVCRHRGAPIATGEGRGNGFFTCPFHAWSYDAQGRLVATTPQAAFPGLPESRQQLTPITVVEQFGLVWLCQESNGLSDPALGALGSELESYGLVHYQHYLTHHSVRGMNWKLAIDGFLENGHFPVLHASTIAPLFIPRISLFDGFGAHLRIAYPRLSLLELRDQPEAEWDFLRHSAIVYVLFPNAVLIWQGDHFEMFRFFPDEVRADRCRVQASLYCPQPALTEKARAHWDRNMELLVRTVDEEDFPLAEQIQRGFAATTRQDIVFGRNEPALAYFHQQIQAALHGP